MIDYPVTSFPCIKCGVELTRVDNDYEAQPNDGIMCHSSGNYGSTIFDPMDGSELAFNICDNCLVRAGKQGRIMVTRSKIFVTTDCLGVVGYEPVDRPYIPWYQGIPDDSDSDGRYYSIEDLEKYQDRLTLRFTIQQMKDRISEAIAKEGSMSRD